MKEKIMIFIIGLLVGAIIATGGCIIYNKINKNTCPNTIVRQNNNGNQPPEMNGERPEMPGNMNSENNEPPAKPEGENETGEQSTTQDSENKQSQRRSRVKQNSEKTEQTA